MILWQVRLTQAATRDELCLRSLICKTSTIQAEDFFLTHALPSVAVLLIEFTRWLDPAAAIAGNDVVQETVPFETLARAPVTDQVLPSLQNFLE